MEHERKMQVSSTNNIDNDKNPMIIDTDVKTEDNIDIVDNKNKKRNLNNSNFSSDKNSTIDVNTSKENFNAGDQIINTKSNQQIRNPNKNGKNALAIIASTYSESEEDISEDEHSINESKSYVVITNCTDELSNKCEKLDKKFVENINNVEEKMEECQVINERLPQITSNENAVENCKIIDEKLVTNVNYRNKVSSDEEDSEEDSSSSSSSSSSDSSDSSEDEESSEDNEPKKNNRKASENHKEKREFDKLPRIEDLHISVPEVLCEPLGKIGWMVEQLVVIVPNPGTPTLNFDSILFLDRGKRVLGQVFEIFGQVADPHYCVRFNDEEHIKQNKIEVGMTVYFCPNTEYTSLVFMTDLLKMKACDDVGEEEQPEFSDDEEERAYYAALKQKQSSNANNSNNNSSSEVPRKKAKTAPKTGWKSRHPWNTNRRGQQQNQRSQPLYNNVQTYGYQPVPWGCPVNNTPLSWIPQFIPDKWPRPCGPQPRPNFPPSAFQGSPVLHRYPPPNYPWQQSTPPNNFWNSPPPPPPPPGV